MKGFMLRDYYALARYLWFFPLLILAPLLFTLIPSINPLFGPAYVMLLPAQALALVYEEDNSRWNAFSLTLPLCRFALASPRYLSSLAIGAVSSLLALLGSLLPYWFGLAGPCPYPRLIQGTLLLFLLFLFHAAVATPINLHFGGQKTRMPLLFLLVFLFQGAAVFLYPLLQWLEAALPFSLWLFCGLVALVEIGLFLTSLLLSGKIMQDKEY